MSKNARVENEGRVIACSKCGRVIKLVKKPKGAGWHGLCECGTGYSLGQRLVRVNGDTKKLDFPAAEVIEEPKAPDRPAKAKNDRSGGQMSGLDAAAKVLADANEPLDTKTMVERMLAQGIWKSSGKTPSATIYSAIIREIAEKKEGARFRKVERGLFAAAK